MEVMIDSTKAIDLPLLNSGKVRDIYEVPEHSDKLLFVTTDRVSAYDVVMNEGVPGKGHILTQMPLFWFKMFSDVSNHLITADVDEYPGVCQPFKEHLRDRSMLVRKAQVLPIECIVRGRWTGSYWKAYNDAQVERTESPYASVKKVCGFTFPSNLSENDKITPPLFTPSTKAEQGLHDENISLNQTKEIIGEEMLKRVSELSVNLYERAAAYALKKGIVIADTKFELGLIDSELVLIDEVLTPDSSRFWLADQVVIGETAPSLDKQYLRNWLSTLEWNKEYPPPTVPDKVINGTANRYQEAYRRLTQ